MATATSIDASAGELRVRAVQLGRLFSTEIERAADSIRAMTREPSIRRHALLWKMYAIPAAHEAVLLPDPALSIIDAWVFARQMEEYFDRGAGQDVFGPHQGIALAAVRRLDSRDHGRLRFAGVSGVDAGRSTEGRCESDTVAGGPSQLAPVYQGRRPRRGGSSGPGTGRFGADPAATGGQKRKRSTTPRSDRRCVRDSEMARRRGYSGRSEMMRVPEALRGPKVWATAILAASILATAGCGSTGGSSANVSVGVGVYGAPMYGPSPWGGYPYPGRYPPGRGGVWIGVPVCCEE